MENYREKLKIDNIISVLLILVLVPFCLYSAGSEFGAFPAIPIAGDIHWQSMWRGFCCGLSFAILALTVYTFFRNKKAIKNGEVLKKLYIQAHDERFAQIRTSAQATSQQIFLWIGMVAVVISGYFNAIVSMTILACVFFVSILSLILVAYYKKKF